MAASILGLDDVCMVFHSLSTEPLAWTGAYRHSGRELDRLTNTVDSRLDN